MSFIYNLTDTWSDAGTTYSAIKMNVTNTASAAASTLMDLQIASASKFVVTKLGRVGIGTATPTNILHIVAAAPRAVIESDTNGNYATWRYIALTAAGAPVHFEQGADITADNTFDLFDRQNNQYVSTYLAGASGYWRWYTNNTERMRIDSAGALLINRSGSSGFGKLNVDGGADFTNGNVYLCRDAGIVSVGTSTPNAASIFDAQSTTKGVRFPNMTTTQKNAIANAAGNVVFDTTLGKLCVNTGSGWQTVTSI